MLVKKFIWDCKQRFTLPNINNAETYIIEEIKVIKNCSVKVKDIILNSNIVALRVIFAKRYRLKNLRSRCRILVPLILIFILLNILEPYSSLILKSQSLITRQGDQGPGLTPGPLTPGRVRIRA
jgi:hypothetical protein